MLLNCGMANFLCEVLVSLFEKLFRIFNVYSDSANMSFPSKKCLQLTLSAFLHLTITEEPECAASIPLLTDVCCLPHAVFSPLNMVFCKNCFLVQQRMRMDQCFLSFILNLCLLSSSGAWACACASTCARASTSACVHVHIRERASASVHLYMYAYVRVSVRASAWVCALFDVHFMLVVIS